MPLPHPQCLLTKSILMKHVSSPHTHRLTFYHLQPSSKWLLPLLPRFPAKTNSDPKKLKESVFFCHLPWLLSAWWKGNLKFFVPWGGHEVECSFWISLWPFGSCSSIGTQKDGPPHGSVLGHSLPHVSTQRTSSTPGFHYHQMLMFPDPSSKSQSSESFFYLELSQ